MKIEFITDFEARTTTGVQLIAAGRIVDLADDKALKLIDAGVAKSVAALPKFNPAALPYISTTEAAWLFRLIVHRSSVIGLEVNQSRTR